MFARRWNWSLCLAVSLAVVVCSSDAPAQNKIKKEPPAKPAKRLSESKLRTYLGGNDKLRAQAFAELKERDDEQLTAKLFIEVLDKEVKRTSAQPRETSIDMIMELGKILRPETKKALLEYLVAVNYRYGMVAAASLGQRKDPDLIDDFQKAWKDKNFKANFDGIFGFRKIVVEALLKIEDPKIVNFCIKLLPTVDGIVRYDILRFLTVMTEQDFGNNAENWKIWWEDNKNDFQFTQSLANADLSSSRNLEIKGLDVPTYYGMKMYAKRIIFVLDISSSMWQDGPLPPNTRFQVAQKELAATLRKLPDDVNFTILTFNAKIKPYKRGKMIAATKDNREKAADWIENYIKWGKGTNSHGALIASFNLDPNAETIMFLSDGKPSKGRITDPAQILAVVRNENRFRKVSIFSIGIFSGPQGADDKLIRFMTLLAEQNNGVYRQIN